MGTVHRASAISLLAAIGFSLIAPGVLLDAESNLPACCRRNGAHRCTMNMDAPAPSSGTALQAIRQNCPWFPLAIATPARSDTAMPAPAAAIFAALIGAPSIQVQAEAHYRVSLSRSHQKRGPPALLS